MTVFSRSAHAHTLTLTHPEGREKYVLALHEYDSSASLGMALAAAARQNARCFPTKVAQQGEVLTLQCLIKRLKLGPVLVSC